MSKEFKDLPDDAKNDLVAKIYKVLETEKVTDKIKFNGNIAHVGILNAG